MTAPPAHLHPGGGVWTSVLRNTTQMPIPVTLQGIPTYLVTVQSHQLSGAIVGGWHHLHKGCSAGVILLSKAKDCY